MRRKAFLSATLTGIGNKGFPLGTVFFALLLNPVPGHTLETIPLPASAETSCDKALERVGKALIDHLFSFGAPPKKLSELKTLGLIERLEAFMCPGSETTLGGAQQIDEKSDFVLLPPGKLEDKTPLVATRPKAGRPRRASDTIGKASHGLAHVRWDGSRST